MAFELFHAHQEIKEREERYKALFFNNHSPMFLIKPFSGEIVEANEAACNFYGWNKEENYERMRDGSEVSMKNHLSE